MSISYDHYRVFYYVATYHSINKAAAIMGNSQPNVSRSIAALEAQIGSKLFNRSSTGVTLTEAGNELYAHAEAAFKHLLAGEEAVRSTQELKGGLLTIGISNGLTRGILHEILIPVIHSFHSKYPQVRLEIVHNSTPSLASDVKNNLVDLALITTDNINGQGIKKQNQKVLLSYNDIVIAGRDFSHLAGHKISLAKLIENPVISLWEETETYEYYKDFFSNHGVEFRPSVKTLSTGQILVYAIENLGIGFIYPKDAEQALKDGLLYKLDIKEKLPKRKISLIKNDKEKKASILFEQILNDHLNL